YVKSSNEAEARAKADTAERARLEEEGKKLKAMLDEQQKKTDSLIWQLANAKDDAEKAKLQKQLDDERAKTESIRKSTGGGPRPASGGDTAPKKKCTPGDPLCTDI